MRLLTHALPAGAPDMAEVGPVLHGAVEVGADGRERPELAGGRPDEDRRAAAELEDLPAVGLHVPGLDGQRHRPGRGLGDLRRDEVAGQGIDRGQKERHPAQSEEPVDEPPTRRIGLQCFSADCLNICDIESKTKRRC